MITGKCSAIAITHSAFQLEGDARKDIKFPCGEFMLTKRTYGASL
jgi:ribosomal protein S4E